MQVFDRYMAEVTYFHFTDLINFSIFWSLVVIKPCGFRNMNCLMKSWTLAMKMDLNLFLPLDEEDFQALKAL